MKFLCHNVFTAHFRHTIDASGCFFCLKLDLLCYYNLWMNSDEQHDFSNLRGVLNQECESLHEIWRKKVTEVFIRKVQLVRKVKCCRSIPVFRNRLSWKLNLPQSIKLNKISVPRRTFGGWTFSNLFCFILFKNTLRALRM